MKPHPLRPRVLFIGGDKNRLASVKIRCVEVAAQLGCDALYGVHLAEQVPAGYDAYVCVKPSLREPELRKLAERAPVVWDIIDHDPPRGLSAYIASTRQVAGLFGDAGPVWVVPHHHCNVERTESAPDSSRIAWIGHRQWYPQLEGIAHEPFFVDGLGRPEIARAYAAARIIVNFRASSPISEAHVRMNSGIKLINCLGFGLPSVSPEEPAYREHGEDCTLFAAPGEARRMVEKLAGDEELYRELRRRCLARAASFHLDAIGEKYRACLEAIAGARAPRADRGWTGLEGQILQAWRGVVRQDAIGLDENFFDLGGDSMRLETVRGQLQRLVDWEVLTTELFRHPTPRLMAAYLARRPAAVDLVERSRRGGERLRQALVRMRGN